MHTTQHERVQLSRGGGLIQGIATQSKGGLLANPTQIGFRLSDIRRDHEGPTIVAVIENGSAKKAGITREMLVQEVKEAFSKH